MRLLKTKAPESEPEQAPAPAPVLRVKDDPEAAAATARLVELREQLSATTRELEALLTAPRAKVDVTAQAAAVVAGADVEEATRTLDDRSAIEKLRREQMVLDEAVHQAEKLASNAMEAAQRRVREAMLPEYRERAAAMARAMIPVGLEQEAAYAFADKVRAAGAGDWPRHFGPLGLARVGVPTNEHSMFCHWLTAAVVFGLIEADEIPARWRQTWGTFRDMEAHASEPSRARIVRARIEGNGAEASAPPARARESARRGGF